MTDQHEGRPERSLSREIRHCTAILTICIAPMAYAFGYLNGRAVSFAVTAALLLLISTVRPKPKPGR